MTTLTSIERKAAEGDVASVIGRVRAGDQDAARELIAHAGTIVIRIARANRPKRLSEEDLMQEIFAKVFSRLDQYRGDAPFEHWVSRIAATTCLDQLRAQRCRPELRMADLPENEVLVLELTQRDSRERLPGHTLAINELLHRLLGRLSPEERRLIEWFELEDKTMAEIQGLTGWNLNVVKKRLFRVRRKLRSFCAELSGFDGATTTHAGPTRWLRGVHKPAKRAKSVPAQRRHDLRLETPIVPPTLSRITALTLSSPAEPAREVA